MKTSLDHLPERQRNDILYAVEIIREYTTPHMIILFGSFSRGDWVEDSYVENGTIYSYVSDYDLLVVLDKESNIEGGLTKHLRKRIRRGGHPMQAQVNVITHGIDYLNEQLEKDHYFFSDIKKEGTLLYDSGKYKLATARKLLPAENQQKAQLYYNQWFNSGNEFLIDFGNAFARQSFNNAAFHLHQATERFCMATLLVFIDYKTKTHDLDLLYKGVCACNALFKTVFPMQTKEEEDRFKVLRDAYIDSRYKLDYYVDPADLEWLASRAQKLKELTEQLCKAKIESYGNR